MNSGLGIAGFLVVLFFLSGSSLAETLCCDPYTSCYPCIDIGLGDVGCVWVGPTQDQYCCDCIQPWIECAAGDTRCHPYDDYILQDCYDGIWHGYMTCLYGCQFGVCLDEPPPPPPDFPDLDEFKPASIAVSPGHITVTMYIMNDDCDMPSGDYIIEVQPSQLAACHRCRRVE